MAVKRQIEKMLHINGNLLCAVDAKISGPCPAYHDLLEIAVVPLNANMRADRTLLPFSARILPVHGHFRRPYVCSKAGLINATQYGNEASTVMKAFESWYERLNLAGGKRIYPIAFNWGALSPFLHDFFGPDYDEGKSYMYEFFDNTFSRDLVTPASYWNDVAFFNQELCPFPKLFLGTFCRRLGIAYEKSMPPLQRASTIAAVYNKLTDLNLLAGMPLQLNFPSIINYEIYTEEQSVSEEDLDSITGLTPEEHKQ